MSEVINKFLLEDDKVMAEMHLKQPIFIYSACRPFPKNNVTIEKFKEIRDTNYIYKNELDKACFQHDMAYGDFKDLKRRRAFDQILRDKALNIAKNPKYDGYQRGLASTVYKCFDKKSAPIPYKSVLGYGIANDDIKQNLQLAKKLHQRIIRKF